MPGQFQGKVSEPVIHQVDRGVAVPKLAVAQHQLARIAYHGSNRVLFEEALEQDELRMQVLRGGIVVHDSDGLIIGSVDGVSGMHTSAGNTIVTAGGPLTVSQAIAAGGGSIDLYVLADDALLAIDAPVSATDFGGTAGVPATA